MDPVTHTLVGVGLANAFLRRRVGPESVWVLAIASNLPDIDALVHLTGNPNAILLRRTFGHSLLLLPLWALALAALARRRAPRLSLRSLYGMSILGAAGHVFFDLVNSFGVVLLWPLSDWRPELAIVFIVDLTLTGILILPLAVCLPRGLRPRLEGVSRAGVACTALYVLLCGGLRVRALELLGETERCGGAAPDFVYAFPEPLGPQRWRGVVREGDLYRISLIRPLAGTVSPRMEVRTWRGDERVERARATPLARRLEWFYKAPVWEAGAGGADVVSVGDLRFVTLGLGLERRPPVFGHFFRVRPDGRVEDLGAGPPS